MNILPGLLSSAMGGGGGAGGLLGNLLGKAKDFVGNVLEDVGEGKIHSFSDFGKSLAKSGAEVLTGKQLPGSGLAKVMKTHLGEPVTHVGDEQIVHFKPDAHEEIPQKSVSELVSSKSQPVEAVKVETSAPGYSGSKTLILPKKQANQMVKNDIVNASTPTPPTLTDTMENTGFGSAREYQKYLKYKSLEKARRAKRRKAGKTKRAKKSTK